MIGIIVSTLLIIDAKLFKIKYENGSMYTETINGIEVELVFGYHNKISILNQMDPSKCIQNCFSCSKPECYLQNSELDHANIKMFDLDKQELVLEPLTYINDKKQSNNQIVLFKFEKYQNSFVNDGFELCFSQNDKTLETQTQNQFREFDPKKQLTSKFHYGFKQIYFKVTYLKFGDTQIDISRCLAFIDLQRDLSQIENFIEIQNESKGHFIKQANDRTYFPKWIFDQLSSELLKYGFSSYEVDDTIMYIITSFGKLPDFLFFNKENELNPIIYTQDSYLIKNFQEEIYHLNFATQHIDDQRIFLGKSFLNNKKVQLNFKENFISIVNYHEERCFKFDRSSLYQEELLVLQISIPSIFILSLLLIQYQKDFSLVCKQRSEYWIEFIN